MDRNIGRTLALIEKVKRWKPEMLVVTTLDGNTHRVKMPDVRRKYISLGDTLKGLAWYKVEAYDAKSLLVGTVTEDPEVTHQLLRGASPAAATSPGVCQEEEEEFLVDDDGPFSERDERLLRLLLDAQNAAVGNQSAQMQMLLETTLKLLQTMTRRLESLEDSYEKTFSLAHEASQVVTAAADGASEDNPQSAALMQQLMPLIMMQLQSPTPPTAKGTPPNGTPIVAAKKAEKADDDGETN